MLMSIQNEVYSIAAQFITGGSSPVTLPFQAFPALALQPSQFAYQASSSSVTFTNGFVNAVKFNPKITKDTPVYAVFFSGLLKSPVQARITSTNKDYKIDQIPAGIQGQSYVVLSLNNTNFSDENIIAGPALLEVYPKGQAPAPAKSS